MKIALFFDCKVSNIVS